MSVGERDHQPVLARHDLPEPLAQVVRVEQLADADAEPPADLVLVARPDAAAGGADLPLRTALGQPLFFHVVGEDDVGMVAENERLGHVDAALGELLDLFEEARRVDDDAVADDRCDVRPEDAGRAAARA